MQFLKKYSLLEIIYLSYCVLRSKCLSRNIRLIRFPIQLRNRSNIKFGKGFTTGVGCRLEVEGSDHCGSKLIIGENVQLNDYVHITAASSVTIGNNVLIASKVYISDVSHGDYKSNVPSSPFEQPAKRKLSSNPVVIEDNVWLGDGVCVLPGVKIGFGSIIGANAVVSKNIPPFSLCVGIPARVVKQFNQETKVWDLMKFNNE